MGISEVIKLKIAPKGYSLLVITLCSIITVKTNDNYTYTNGCVCLNIDSTNIANPT